MDQQVLETSADRSIDLLIHERFVRATSTGRIGIFRSIGTVSRNYSHGRSSPLVMNESLQDSTGRFRSSASMNNMQYITSRDFGNHVLESISLSRELAAHILGDVDDAMLAQVGEPANNELLDGGFHKIENENLRIATENLNDVENEGRSLSADDVIVSRDGVLVGTFGANSASFPNSLKDNSAHLPTKEMSHSAEKVKMQDIHITSGKEKQDRLPLRLDHVSYLAHLAVFSILGIFTRYLLQKLFGPSILALTSDDTPLYLDLPCNMLGSFLMGWFGIVFKADLRNVSEHVVIGLTTGYMGSLTTFSEWNQKMLNLSSEGHVTFALAGIIIGMFIVNECIYIGVESAEWLRRTLLKRLHNCSEKTKSKLKHLRVHTFMRHVTMMIIMLVIWATLWSLSVPLASKDLHSLANSAALWLGCLVGPPGVWARWHLAKLNGQGLGKKRLFKWIPFGTLSANVLAACLMAALSIISKAVNTTRFKIIVLGVEFGFLGCMSTVSTFVAEVYAMRRSGHHGRALAYTALTILSSFVIGILIYSLPVWIKHYN